MKNRVLGEGGKSLRRWLLPVGGIVCSVERRQGGKAAAPSPVSMERSARMENASTVTMCATVCKVNCCDLCVCDHCTNQEVVVHYDTACCFHVGERVCIYSSGAMPNSLPPQSTATCIRRM